MSILSAMRSPLKPAIGLEAEGGGPVGEQLTNRDFETGDFTGWTTKSAVFGSWTDTNGLYGTDAPNVGWDPSIMTNIPLDSTRFLTPGGDNSAQAEVSEVNQSFACPAGAGFTMTTLAGSSFGTSPDYGIMEAIFKDGGGTPIPGPFRNTLLTEVIPDKTYIRLGQDGFIDNAGDFVAMLFSWSYCVYYQATDKTKIMIRRQATNDWAFITATGGWDVDDLTYGDPVGAHTVDDTSAVGSDNISNVFFPQYNEESNADFRRYSDNWMVGTHFFGLSSRTGYEGTLTDVTPAGTAECEVRLFLRRIAPWIDNCSFVLL